MVYRFSWIAGIVAMSLALVRLNELLRPTVEGAPWQLVVVAGALLGAVITWTALAYRLNSLLVAALNLVALVVISVRIAVPDTTVWLLPTGTSFSDLQVETDYAFSVIRSGVAPVIPATGLVVVITAVFWGLGALLVWGLQKGYPYVALVPPGILYIQLATADRGYAGLGWTLGLLIVIAGSLAAVTFDERSASAGRLTRMRRRPVSGVISTTSLVTLAAALVLALTTATAFAGAVPATGVLEWRRSSGLTGEYFGSVAYNPFVSIQKGLVSQNNIPVFTATLSGDVDARDVYWRLLSLDTFNGIWWYANSPQMTPLDESEFETPDTRFDGPTVEVLQDITIQQLRNDWLPGAYSPTAVSADNLQVERGIRVANDGSLRFGALSFRGMNYRIRSELPQPDLGVLALGPDGLPSQAFLEAVEAGDLEVAEELPRTRDVSDRHLDLPEDVDPQIIELAENITFGLESTYERGLAIEAYLRNPDNGFRYSVEVPPGADSSDLAAWLFDTQNPNFRLGYCEQYAASMGVLARAAGIPSRVVLGFTPGRQFADGTVVVLDNNAHAWVELWLPTQGWVRFDPTPRNDGINPSTVDNLPIDIREQLIIEPIAPPDFEGAPLPLPQLADDENIPRFVGAGADEPQQTTFSVPAWLTDILLITIVVGIALGLVPALKWWRRRRRMRKFESGDITAAWDEIISRLTDLGDPPRPGMTPVEVARTTDRVMVPLASVYSEVIYGPSGSLPPEGADTAATAFAATEASFAMRYSPTRRALAWYRIRSLLPSWLRRRRR